MRPTDNDRFGNRHFTNWGAVHLRDVVEGAGFVIDDLVDTGATMKVVREMLPKAHVATVYAKPLGRPLVDTFVTEVSQDTWIYFPWDLELSYAKPISGRD